MLELKHLSYAVHEDGGELGILNDISLTVGSGRLVVFTGPNGGGKTTLAKIISGIAQPAQGRLFFDGQDITRLGVTRRAKLGICHTFQQPVRFRGISVRDLLLLAAGEGASEEKLIEPLEQVGLCPEEYLNREVDGSLSGGEIKRIEIAGALARGAQLTIFDEPEAGIDLWSFAKLTETFRYIHDKREATIIIISHQERILNIADRIVVLADGQVVNDGPRKDILPTLLGGAPGVRSARYGADHTPAFPGESQDARNIRKLLDALAEMPEERRGARFVTVMAVCKPGGADPLIVRGEWEGRILAAPRGSGGFGYDPVFFDPVAGRAAAELTPEEKLARSHRGRALRELLRLWSRRAEPLAE